MAKRNRNAAEGGQKPGKPKGGEARTSGFLHLIERLGNKLPHPFWLFVWISLFMLVASGAATVIGLKAVNPQTQETVHAVNLLSADGLRLFVERMVTNFSGFAPVGLVLVMLMGVSIAEKSGFLPVLMRTIAFSVPRGIVLPVIFILGACGNIGSDAGVVIIPPIAAIIFLKMGLHPVAGLVVGYAGATAGFTANFFIAGTDVLLAGISSEVVSHMPGVREVSATANWYFMIVSTVALGFAGAFIARRFTIPRMGTYSPGENGVPEGENGVAARTPLTRGERRGLVLALLFGLLYVGLIVLLSAPQGAPLRDPETGGIVPSPLLRGLVPILFFFFTITGTVYGKIAGTIKKSADVLEFMTQGMRDLAGYIVLMVVVAQFINFFNWSRLDTILAISGAEFLKTTGLTGPLLFVLFVIMIAGINIFIGSGSAKWAIFAPIFIPMLAQLNYSPAFVQLMYRIGDSVTNGISPMYPYFPLLLGWIHKYDKRAGIGTVVTLLLPYAIGLLILWLALMFVWYFTGLPIGVGETVYMSR
jgi:aminobenzoyl-glutamate transport protein